MKKRILSLLLAVIMMLGMLPATVLAADTTVQWAGAMNFNDANNQVVNTTSMTVPNLTEMKWAYPLNNTVINGGSTGAYYAGSQVIVGNDLYATGGGRLHKVDITTGTGGPISAEGATVGSTGNYYDYLCYADGILIVATQTKLEAFSLSGVSLGSVEGTYGYYHPVQYHDGHVFCNGYIYKLEKTDSSAAFTQVGSNAIGGDTFNWSSGVFLNGLFYTVSKTTVYAVDHKTNTVVDSYAFDAARTATYNTQSGPAYDAATGRLFWSTYTYNNDIHSIQIDSAEGDNKGKFVSGSYMSADAKQKSVCTPVVYNGRVYLAGQQGRMCVLNTSDLSQVYSYVTLGGGRVQGNPILSTAGGKVQIYVQCSNGHLYLFTDNGDSGSAVKLGETDNRTDVNWAYAGYEQYAMDSAGNFYCYNESGYLFCFGVAPCEVPTITTDLETEQVKYSVGASEVTALTVAAEVTDGGTLSYQWQSGTDGKTWTDIDGAETPSYTPSTALPEGTTSKATYYRCVVTNTKDTATTSTASSPAHILVKVLSNDTTLNVLVNASNSLNASSTTTNTMAAASTADSSIVYITNCSLSSIKNLWLGTVSDGTISNFEILQGLASNRSVPKFTSKSSSNTYNGIAYSGYYRSNYYTLPIVAKATVTAENGAATKDYYIVIDDGEAAQYTVSVTGFTADNSAYYTNSGVSFTEAGQTVTLTPVTSSIGSGTADAPAWTWSSSDVTVAKVDENGVVTSVGGGTATVTASWQKISASCTVTSTAAAHTTHTYTDGVCSICGTGEPSALKAYFSLVGQDGKVALSKDGATELYKAELSVKDADGDGTLTLNDAFLTAHETHSTNGTADFATESSDYGAYITKLWGVQTGSVGYYQNGASPSGLSAELKRNDVLTAFFYQDTTTWSDIYTSITGQSTVSANNAVTYTVSGLAGGAAAVPKGATVKVYDITNNAEVSAMATTVGEDGTFTLTFANAGSYTVEVNGTAAYTGQVWDASLNDGQGGYKDQTFTAAPVIPSRVTVKVLPQVSKTVYVSISCKNGSFAVNKNGDEMYRFPVTATDDAADPDGNVTIMEVLVAAHEQYHPDGASAVSQASFITKLWGENNGGNCSYYFNDLYMSGSGTKTGTNGRPFQDRLLNTVVEDNDCFYIYSFQATNWTKGDLYTYFAPVTETAVAGTPKTLTVKSAGGYGSNANKLETSLVKVTDSHGVEQTALNTTVGADGTFSITFPSAGTYTVDIRTNGTNYVTPTRCTVTVSAGQTQPQTITASISVVDPNGGYFLPKRSYTVDPGTTAADLLLNTDLNVVSSSHSEYGLYVESINGIGEFDFGSGSGWMFKINGEFPRTSAANCVLEDGDLVEWVYTRDLGTDVGDTSYVKPEPEAGVISGGSVTLAPEAAVNKNGEATVEVEAKLIDSALEQAAERDDITAVVIAPAIDGEADKVTVELPKSAVSSIAKDSDLDLTVSTSIADVTISNEGLTELATKSGSTVSISAEAVRDKTGAATGEVKIDVAVNNKTVESVTGGLVVTIPVEDAGAGTVLVIVDPDGTETIVKRSVSGEGGVTALLNGSATVKVVDNSKSFSDTTGHWAENAIDFVAAREIFNGTGTGFAPDTTMTRAMLVTTLYRLEGAVAEGTHDFHDVPNDTWYTDAVIWASSNHIVNGTGNGFMPEGNITREQLATMLCRYAQYLGMDTTAKGDLARFHDHGSVSTWAKDAMEWAVGVGLINGKTGSKLDPTGNATRGEVAVVYQRLIALMVK